MEENKQQITEEDLYKSLPDVLKEALELLQQEFINVSPAVILNYLICNLFRMYSSKKVTIDEAGETLLMNWFSLIFMDSGDGKDRLASTIDSHLLKQYKQWYAAEAESLFHRQMQEYEENLKKKEGQNEQYAF